ncbi:ATP-binding protein [Ideonella sp.]|uniref:ATP-binding protein n=1 Tax=Ideonella sp. TaxID=1929293 RepID=UPI002B47C5D1|nr:ATP-binding protein [Ideonella sp.]HJV71400.1 ATP-binding protein [Ideonella sp.]
MGRLSLVMVAGVLVTQLAGNMIWVSQWRAKAATDVRAASQHIGRSAASAIRFFRSVPPNYRALLIQQSRDLGGMRFFVQLGKAPVAIRAIEPGSLSRAALEAVGQTLKAELPPLPGLQLAFAWPDQLAVTPEGVTLAELPADWVEHTLLIQPDPAPVLVIQAELEPGHWLYLATLMPNPYFLASNDPLSTDRLVLQGLSLAAVLLMSILFALRWITRPLKLLSEAAEAFGQDERAPELPETGSKEFVKTARAFGAMRQRIRKYLDDRERLFISISHDLRTPITRLKLRAELLDDEALRSEFDEDLDELDMMVKGALQCVKDSDIHENPTELKLDGLLQRLVRGARLAGHPVACRESGLAVWAKPLALRRALGNLVDNALHYGERVEIGAHADGPGWVRIDVRDHGPGVPEDALATLFEPRVRLLHGRERNEGGLGLGLGIARSIVEAHGGQLTLANHPEGGLVASVRLPTPQVAAGLPEAAL